MSSMFAGSKPEPNSTSQTTSRIAPAPTNQSGSPTPRAVVSTWMIHGSPRRSASSSPDLGGFTREPEDALADDVAQHVRGAAHDRVRRAVAHAPRPPVPQRGLRAERAADEVGDALLELRAERLGDRARAGEALSEHALHDEQAADLVRRLDAGDLLAHTRVRRVGEGTCVAVQRLVRHEPVDAAALVLELAHGLTERVVLLADEVGRRHPHVVE